MTLCTAAAVINWVPVTSHLVHVAAIALPPLADGDAAGEIALQALSRDGRTLIRAGPGNLDALDLRNAAAPVRLWHHATDRAPSACALGADDRLLAVGWTGEWSPGRCSPATRSFLPQLPDVLSPRAAQMANCRCTTQPAVSACGLSVGMPAQCSAWRSTVWGTFC